MDIETETEVSYLRGRDLLEDALCEIKYRVQCDGVFQQGDAKRI